MKKSAIKLTTFLTLSLILISSIGAQEETAKNTISEIRKNNYQIELGFSSIKSIYSNTSSASIFFKKKYRTGNLVEVNSMKFLRAFFSIDSQVNLTEDPSRTPMDTTSIFFHPANVSDLTLGIGIEKQYQNDRFVHYLGCDLFARYYKSDDDVPNNYNIGGVTLNIINTTDRYLRIINPGLIAFGGFKYYITNQFSVGVETGLRIGYFNSKITEVEYTFDFEDGMEIRNFEENDPVKSNGFKVNFLGLRFVTLGYSFK